MIQNIGDFDRLVRITLGVSLIVPTTIGLIGPIGWVGLFPLLTGIFQLCPAYLMFRRPRTAPPTATNTQERGGYE